MYKKERALLFWCETVIYKHDTSGFQKRKTKDLNKAK